MVGGILKALSLQGMIALHLLAFNAWGYLEDECARCHGFGSEESKLQIDVGRYKTSIHAGEIGCTNCHEVIIGDEHITEKGLEKVNCQKCHNQQNLHSKDASTECADCHTRHTIYGADDLRSSVNWRNLKSTCGTCHPAQTKSPSGLSMLTSFHIASHPKQDMASRFEKDMCVGCHQGRAAHGEKGLINSQNCYKCHFPLNNKRIILGYIHTYADWQRQPINSIMAYVSLIVLIGCIFVLSRAFVGLSVKAENDGGI